MIFSKLGDNNLAETPKNLMEVISVATDHFVWVLGDVHRATLLGNHYF